MSLLDDEDLVESIEIKITIIIMTRRIAETIIIIDLSLCFPKNDDSSFLSVLGVVEPLELERASLILINLSVIFFI